MGAPGVGTPPPRLGARLGLALALAQQSPDVAWRWGRASAPPIGTAPPSFPARLGSPATPTPSPFPTYLSQIRP